jgi:hypothetical protein
MRWWSANLVPPRSKTWHQHRSGNIAVSSNGYVCPDCSAADSVLFYSHQNHFGPKASPTQRNMANGVEFRIMPSDDEGHWYWEVIKDGHEVVARGVAETEPAACEQADEAARKAKLIA